MQEETQNHKIKIVYRWEQNACRRELYTDSNPHSETVCGADCFLQAFAPEQLLQKLAVRQNNAVLVFRTSEAQMQEFCQFPGMADAIRKQMQ